MTAITKWNYRTLLFASIFIVLHLTSMGQKKPPPYFQPDWTRPYESFRIVGNLYYVGTYDLACYLITTPSGHILINTGLDESINSIRASVEKLGFKFSDIKILLATHAHHDHVGAFAAIRKETGAKILINENDALELADGGESDYAMGGDGILFEPVKPDSLLHKNDTIRFGGMEILPLHHPGHTKGATSFLFDIKDTDRSYRVLIANMPTLLNGVNLSGMPGYQNIGKDYTVTFDGLKNLQFDIWLASHAAQFKLHTKRKPGDLYNPKAFIDRAGYDKTLEGYKHLFLSKLKGN
ncbi:MAG: subclass B3 metallo-beta-lactamase [Chitinophagaceae bacterium]